MLTEDSAQDLSSKQQRKLIFLDSKDPSDWDLMKNSVVGGKALHLAEMIVQASKEPTSGLIQVPKACVLTTYAYDSFVEELGLEKELVDILASADNSSDVLEPRLVKVREAITKGSLVSSLENAIQQFAKQVGSKVGVFSMKFFIEYNRESKGQIRSEIFFYDGRRGRGQLCRAVRNYSQCSCSANR